MSSVTVLSVASRLSCGATCGSPKAGNVFVGRLVLPPLYFLVLWKYPEWG